MQPIRILIVEDDPDWRRGLHAYLSDYADFDVCALAETSEKALKAFEHYEIDVVLMDIMLASSMEGIWLTAEITQNWGAKVIMLTSLEENQTIFDAFQAGAIDYLIKSDFKKIPDAIRAAYENQAPISADAADKMRQEFRRLKQLERELEQLKAQEIVQMITPAEAEILERIHQGMTQTEIAEQLFISIRTVKVHVGNIIRKLGVSSSKEAATVYFNAKKNFEGK